MKIFHPLQGCVAITALLLAGLTSPVSAAFHSIDGITGPNFTLTAKAGYVSSSEGNSTYFWGYANGSGPAAKMQYPGPSMIVNQGQTVVVTLFNELPVPVSLVFPGQAGVIATGGVAGTLTQEVPAGAPGSFVTYTFTASQPGTYLYQSGTRQDLETEMGLVGALIVRPNNFNPATVGGRRAYNHADSRYDHEQLFLLTDVDEHIHVLVELQTWLGMPVNVDMTRWFPQYWYMNGRSGFDTLLPANAPWLPHQPYDSLVLTHPGEKVLMRVIDAGRDRHPLHHHGNHARVIARDGRLLNFGPASAGANLAYDQFTVSSSPGSTVDQIWNWTGEKLGWDVYGHKPGDPMEPGESLPAAGGDHGKPFPTKMPSAQDLSFGMLYSGSPFLGSTAPLPPGEGGFNPGAFMYMFHSHAERELCDGNVFPGGMMTFCLVAPPP